MFDIGFWELALIFVVALLVLGPERLPRAARTVGLWIGKARQILSSVKSDIDRELRAEELKAMVNKGSAVSELQDLVREVNTDIDFESEPAEDRKKAGAAKRDGEPAAAEPEAADKPQAAPSSKAE